MYSCKVDRTNKNLEMFLETEVGTLEKKEINLVPLLSSGTILNKPCVGMLAKLYKSYELDCDEMVFNCITNDNIRKSLYIQHSNLDDIVMLNNLKTYTNLDILYFLLCILCSNVNTPLINHVKNNTFTEFSLPNSNIPNVTKITDIFTLIKHENNDYSTLIEYKEKVNTPLCASRLYMLPNKFSIMFNPTDNIKDYILNEMSIDDIFKFTLSLCDFFDISHSWISRSWSNSIFFVEVL